MIDTLILCIGNQEGGDYGIGPYIAELLKSELSQEMILDFGTMPEKLQQSSKEKNQKTLVIVDAAEMNLPAGEIRIILKEKISTMHINSHGIPLSLFIQYLEKEVKYIIFIGIQPQTMQGMISSLVKKAEIN